MLEDPAAGAPVPERDHTVLLGPRREQHRVPRAEGHVPDAEGVSPQLSHDLPSVHVPDEDARVGAHLTAGEEAAVAGEGDARQGADGGPGGRDKDGRLRVRPPVVEDGPSPGRVGDEGRGRGDGDAAGAVGGEAYDRLQLEGRGGRVARGPRPIAAPGPRAARRDVEHGSRPGSLGPGRAPRTTGQGVPELGRRVYVVVAPLSPARDCREGESTLIELQRGGGSRSPFLERSENLPSHGARGAMGPLIDTDEEKIHLNESRVANSMYFRAIPGARRVRGPGKGAGVAGRGVGGLTSGRNAWLGNLRR